MEKKLALLATILLINPITLWLLTESFVLSVVVSVLVLVVSVSLSSFASSLRMKVWWFNVLAIVSIGYHAELVFRTLHSDKDVPNLYEVRDHYYFNKQYLNQKFENIEFLSHYKTNSQGLRIPMSTDADKTISDCDWLFIGDSFTQGAQVEYEEMFSSIIAKQHPEKVVVNAGISGAGICELYHYLKDEGIKLNPKKVFIQIGVFNDFTNVVERSATFSDWLMEKSAAYRYLISSLSEGYELPLGRWCEPFRPDKQGNIDDNILYKETSEKKEADKAALRNYIKKINSLCKEHGAELCVILLPSKEQASADALNEVMTAYDIKPEGLDMTYPNRWMAEFVQKENISFVDLYDAFATSKGTPFFRIDEHLTADGHSLIAKVVSDSLLKEKAPYRLISKGWGNERYPSLLSDGGTILYQNFDGNETYRICLADTLFDFQNILIKSCEELIHPTIAWNGRFVAFSQGDQSVSRTTIQLIDKLLGTSVNITSEGMFGAIPSFSSDGSMIALPVWEDSKTLAEPHIDIFDTETSKKILSIPNNGKECWRPIFSNDNKSVYYIQKEKNFVIKQYDIALKQGKTLLETDYDIWDITLSPSGRFMAFAGNKGGSWSLYLYDMSGKRVKQLTDSKANEWDPSFGIDDNDLLFAVESGFFNGICRMKFPRW